MTRRTKRNVDITDEGGRSSDGSACNLAGGEHARSKTYSLIERHAHSTNGLSDDEEEPNVM